MRTLAAVVIIVALAILVPIAATWVRTDPDKR